MKLSVAGDSLSDLDKTVVKPAIGRPDVTFRAAVTNAPLAIGKVHNQRIVVNLYF